MNRHAWISAVELVSFRQPVRRQRLLMDRGVESICHRALCEDLSIALEEVRLRAWDEIMWRVLKDEGGVLFDDHCVRHS